MTTRVEVAPTPWGTSVTLWRDTVRRLWSLWPEAGDAAAEAAAVMGADRCSVEAALAEFVLERRGCMFVSEDPEERRWALVDFRLGVERSVSVVERVGL